MEIEYPSIKINGHTVNPDLRIHEERFDFVRGYLFFLSLQTVVIPPNNPFDDSKSRKKGCDVLCGSRYVKGGKRVGDLMAGVFSSFVGVTLHLLTGIPTKDVANAYKMYRKDVLLSLNLKEKGFAISMEACVKFFIHKYKICDVPTAWYGRKKGKSKFKLSKTLPYIKLYLWTIWKRWISL